MLFERRAYRMEPGRGREFPGTQTKRGFDGPVSGFMSRLIGYFETLSGPSDEVVHLYRFDDYGDWLEKLHGIYPLPELEAYFRNTRAIMREQATNFYQLAPVEGASPLWMGGRDWQPVKSAPLWDMAANPGLIVEETASYMVPGGLADYWPAVAARPDAALGPADRRLAVWFALTGRLHGAIRYRVFLSHGERAAALERDAADPEAQAFANSVGPLIASEQVSILRPVQVPEMSPLFNLA